MKPFLQRLQGSEDNQRNREAEEVGQRAGGRQLWLCRQPQQPHLVRRSAGVEESARVSAQQKRSIVVESLYFKENGGERSAQVSSAKVARKDDNAGHCFPRTDSLRNG